MRLVPLLAITALLAMPAGAFDLTGTWAGGYKCAGFDGLKFKVATKSEAFEISQTGNALNVMWVGVAPLEGIAIPDLSKPDQQGSAALIDCDTTTDLSTGYAEIYDLQVKIDRVKGKGKLKGKSIWSEDGDTVGECKWSFQLIDLADPGALGCP